MNKKKSTLIIRLALLIGTIVSLTYVPLFIGVYILLSLLSQKFNDKIKRFESYYLIGFIQSGFSIVVGATGPLATTLLVKDYNDKHTVVATAAADTVAAKNPTLPPVPAVPLSSSVWADLPKDAQNDRTKPEPSRSPDRYPDHRR